MRTQFFNSDFFKKNRLKLMQHLNRECWVILVANMQYPCNGDQFYPFRQDSDFYWCTGLTEASLVYAAHPVQGDCLFVPQADERTRQYEGEAISPRTVRDLSGIDEVRPMDDLQDWLAHRIKGEKNIYMNLGANRRIETPIISPARLLIDGLGDALSHVQIKDITPDIGKLRVVKTDEEIDALRKASRITGAAYLKILKMLRPGIYEYEIEAEMIREFTAAGAEGHAFPPIVASGKNACTLHYTENASRCKDGELVLIDFGADYGYYAGDCSRTLPVNGRYSEFQASYYQAVLDVYKQVMPEFKPGTSIDALNSLAGRIMEEVLLDRGILELKEVRQQSKELPAFKKYFMHGLSHFIGLDVHDTGDRERLLEPNMVLSCEPGIYDAKHGVGVRLETDIVIRENAHEDLFAAYPIEIDDIENAMR